MVRDIEWKEFFSDDERYADFRAFKEKGVVHVRADRQ